ncbi:FtsX-like permease family protein [Bacillus carboniphilus]|uniref:FtsX-like permease family protein n=1 Tax=Bacillus carboniphilus TaxID=86663 RepID=A0ABN0WNV2_9BACI
MNIVNKLTLRHLKHNKKRTLITIIGVIISVAMVTAVTTLGTSFMDLFQRQTIAKSGEWHVQYQDVTKEQLQAIKDDDQTAAVTISKDIGYAHLLESKNKNKPYLFIRAYNETGYKKFPIELSSGRLPTQPNEIVISDHISSNGKVDIEIGDVLTLQVGKRLFDSDEGLDQNTPLFKNNENTVVETFESESTMSFTVVGTIQRPEWEPTWAPGYTVVTYTDETYLGKNETINASVVVKKINKDLFSQAEQLVVQEKIDTVKFNNELLRYYGVIKDNGLRTTLFSLSAIIMLVIIVGSVSLIYNAFAISVSERSRHLGMLSSVGATKIQKRNSVFFEGAIIGVISIPIGIISGLAGIGVTFYFINNTIHGVLGVSEPLTVSVSAFSILAACAVSIVTIFISTFIPAIRASKVSAIDAIRQTADVKLTSKAVKTSKLVRKIFGLEAEIGLKNLKRNKRRYNATVFSLVISILLFLSVSYFTDSLKKSVVLSQDGINFDIQVNLYNAKDEAVKNLYDSVSAIDHVTEMNRIQTFHATTWVKKDKMAGSLREMVEKDSSMLSSGTYPYYMDILSLDTESLEEFAEKAGIATDELLDPEGKKAIIVNTTTYQDIELRKYVETQILDTQEGDQLELVYTDFDSGEEKPLGSIEVAGLTDQLPMGVRNTGLGGINVIVSDAVFDQLVTENINSDSQNYIYLKSSDPMKTQEAIEEIGNTMEEQVYVYNVYKSRQNDEQMILFLSVFTYGFIVLITSISVANIFNTISTSISLRKREFAMLKSVGMTPKGFNKMINYESIFYGVKALLYGLPISIAVMYLLYRSLSNTFDYSFTLPWDSLLFTVIAVFLIVSSAMLYSSSKVKKENIIDALKQENI